MSRMGGARIAEPRRSDSIEKRHALLKAILLNIISKVLASDGAWRGQKRGLPEGPINLG
jgi:hypothetical protein